MVHLGAVDVGSAISDGAMKRFLLFLAMCALFMPGCKTETGTMSRIATFEDDGQLRQLYDQHHAPLVVVGHGVYLPPDECLCRKTNAAVAAPSQQPPPEENPSQPTESRVNEEDHTYGGFAEQRVFGGGSLPIKCTTRGDCRGFQVIIPNGGEVRYFDGSALKPAADGFVPIPK